MQSRNPQSRAHGLDGVRALAVLAVMGFHEGASALSGGFLGVDVFFVLSGFLITDLLLTQRPTLRDFWSRRARRLLPPLAVMLVMIMAAATLIEPAGNGELRGALLAAVTYTSNWYQMLHHVPYFDSFGPLPPLQHLWSLAIEEQFYLVWPLLLSLLIIRHNDRAVRIALTLLGAAGSAVAMGVLYRPADPSAVYYGTDTHASALLIGAAMAIAFPLGTLRNATAAVTQRFDIAGMAGLVVLAWACGHFAGDSPSLYPYGLVIAAVAAAGLVAAAASTGAVASTLSLAPLRWIGVRSYAMYLWHWPVIALTSKLAGGNTNPLLWVAETACTVMLAAVSWRFVESPILQDGFRMTVRTWTRGLASTVARNTGGAERLIPAAVTVAALAVVGVAGYGLAGPAQPSADTGLLRQVAEGERISAASQQLPPASPAAVPPSAPTTVKATRPAGSGARQPHVVRACHQPARLDGRDVTAVGDSVMLAAAGALEADLPGLYMDAKISRQMSTGVRIVQRLAAEGALRRVVIVDLGTNGPISAGQIWELRLAAGPSRELVLVSVYGPMSWTSDVNNTLRVSTWRKAHVAIADWAAAVASRPGLLWSDGIHPQPAGADLYARIITSTIRANPVACART